MCHKINYNIYGDGRRIEEPGFIVNNKRIILKDNTKIAFIDTHTLYKLPLNINKNDFYTFRNKKSYFAMTGHVVYQNIDKLNSWKNIVELIPNFYVKNKMNRTGIAGIFAASLELTKEGVVKVSQNKIFDKLMIKKN